MTIAEATTFAHQLTDITVKYWDSTSFLEKDKLRKQFSSIASAISANGFKLRKSRSFDAKYNRFVPKYTIKENKNECFLERYNPRPSNLKTKTDCTTRCITYCTGEDYMVIRNEQMQNSRRYGGSWQVMRIWSKSLESRGFKMIVLPKHMSRATFIKRFSSKITSGIFATRSSGHIAAIDMAKRKVVDSWDSTGGRITHMFIHESQYDMVSKLLIG
jgi:hypothetical protein